MIKKWLDWAAYALIAFSSVFFTYGLLIEWMRPNTIYLEEIKPKSTAPPKNSFALSQDAYNQIGEPTLCLECHSPKMQLPDLKQKINYYGQNNRPDAGDKSSILHFNLSADQTAQVAPGEKLYLTYDKDKEGGKYSFSPHNKETSLWIEGKPGDKEASIIVKMYDENGNLVMTPDANAHFSLKEKEFARFGGQPWEIGKWRVDGTLLARQKARWYGSDLFLERHGGEEFSEDAGKNRIDFGDNDEKYSVYVQEGATLIWDGTHWVSVKPGEASRGLPLLFVRKIDDRLMSFDFWDQDGKKKIALNLIKSMETWSPQNLQQQFKFLGARTRSQFVFEVDDEKMLLSPNDWLLLTDEGWTKLDTLEEIDKYVELKEVGTLFVFDGITRVGDQQVLKGEMFNPTRTKVHDLELPVQKDGLVYQQIDKDKKRLQNGLNQKSPLQYVKGSDENRKRNRN